MIFRIIPPMVGLVCDFRSPNCDLLLRVTYFYGTYFKGEMCIIIVVDPPFGDPLDNLGTFQVQSRYNPGTIRVQSRYSLERGNAIFEKFILLGQRTSHNSGP